PDNQKNDQPVAGIDRQSRRSQPEKLKLTVNRSRHLLPFALAPRRYGFSPLRQQREQKLTATIPHPRANFCISAVQERASRLTASRAKILAKVIATDAVARCDRRRFPL